jgi:rubredoxin
MPRLRPCPHCGIPDRVQPVAFTWWGGPIGPRLLSHVRCKRCGLAFNGRTGQSNTNGIIAWAVLTATFMAVLIVLVKELGRRLVT